MKYRFVLPITGLFVATLLISNTLDTKIFMFFGLALPAGVILFPLAYLFADVLTEVYGFSMSRRIIWTGFASLVLMVVFYEIAQLLPPAGFWENQKAFETTLSQVPRIVLASMLAYLVGEFANSFTLAKMKIISKGKQMSLRFVASTFVGQAVDTTVFVLIAFIGQFPPAALFQIIASAWAVKVGWEIVALPITLPIVRWLKAVEKEDYFDRDTNFNPFRV
jgi:queuosine precursor transporter